MAPAMTSFGEPEAKVWLGGEHGGRKLRAETIARLLAGFGRDNWRRDDVPSPKTSFALTWKLWAAILDDIDDAEGDEMPKAERTRLSQWMEAQVRSAGDESKDADVPYTPSAREAADLRAQGMSDSGELKHLELAAALGRTGAKNGTENGSYAGYPNSMKEVALAIKQQAPTLDKCIAECEKVECSDGLHTWFVETAESLGECDMVELHKQGANVMSFWHDTLKNLCRQDRAVIAYVKAYRKKYRGRGFPVRCDRELVGIAMHEEMTRRESSPKVGGRTATLGELAKGGPYVGGSSTGGSSIGSSLGSSLPSSAGNSNVIVAIQEQQSAMMVQMAEVVKTVAAIGDRVRDMDRGPRTNPHEHTECHNCGEKGHVARLCTKPKKPKKTEGE